ncbi:F-box/LRR-repeat protein 15 [Microcaecilia unicolor]|uniref:F-box/LRR-repeat protein 15 n=1 Tax=Microcaecilia unicolor TaxID=1415580 RepID=A0A6P7Y3J0_9AMPH|nr:F-box/LRR-repeat protein 15 [Microcaecilia unicolor]XP_030059409.1 F-box/LRR-repeat protein 15 [Microcaecilia unicolor]
MEVESSSGDLLAASSALLSTEHGAEGHRLLPLAKDTGSYSLYLLDLPWEDVLIPHVLCHLPVQQLLRLQRVSKLFQSLIELYLANCRCFDSTQVGLYLPKTAFCRMLKDNKVLQKLDLRSCSDWLTDSELLPVIGQNQNLLQINLNKCTLLTRQSLVAISLSCPHLQDITLGHCEWVDGLSLRILTDHCKDLEGVNLTACRQLKDEAVCYLVQKSHRLKSLSLAVNANICDVAVEETAKCCPDLEHLDLTGCLRVKNESIRMLAEYCPRLLSLRVKYCHNVTESSLDVLRKRSVEIDVEPPLRRALVILPDDIGFAPFINLQI